jgi:hypothetical protein
MPFDMAAYLENRRRFLANRAAFPVEELTRYAGLWVAWSPDGTRAAASAEAPEALEGLLRAAGEDPLLCALEGIPDADPVVDMVQARATPVAAGTTSELEGPIPDQLHEV